MDGRMGGGRAGREREGVGRDREEEGEWSGRKAVYDTHLTLPTIYSGSISVGAVPFTHRC